MNVWSSVWKRTGLGGETKLGLCPASTALERQLGWGSQQGGQEARSLESLWSGSLFPPSVWGGNVLKGRSSGTVSQAERRGPPPSQQDQAAQEGEGLQGESVPVLGRASAGSEANLSPHLCLLTTCPAFSREDSARRGLAVIGTQ